MAFSEKMAMPNFLYATSISPVSFVGAILFQLPYKDIIAVFRGRTGIFLFFSSKAKNMPDDQTTYPNKS